MERSVERYLLEHGHEVVRERMHGVLSGGNGPSERGYGDWFDERVLGLDSEDYRRSFWREAHTTGHTIGHMPRTLDTLLREQCGPRADVQCGLLLAVALLQGGIYPFWLLSRLLAREVGRLRRSTYYARERERRHRLADERRAIRIRRTVNPRPSIDEIRAAWARVRATAPRGGSASPDAVPSSSGTVPPSGETPRGIHAMAVLRLGALLEDLERYVDNHAYVTRGVSGIRGRAPGIKGFFADEAPDLREAYKSVMRCKALAKRYRQACGCGDPVPAEVLLPVQGPSAVVTACSPDPNSDGKPAQDFTAEPSAARSPARASCDGTRVVGGLSFLVFPCLGDVAALQAWMAEHGNTAYLRTQDWVPEPEGRYSERNLLPSRALETAVEILRFGDGTLVALEAAVALRIDPDCVPREADSAGSESSSSVRVMRCLGGERPLRVAGRVRAWISRWRGRTEAEGASSVEAAVAGA